MPQGENFAPGVIIEDLGARLTRLFKVRGKVGDYLGLGTEIVPTYDVADLLSREETQAGLDLVNARFDLRVAPVEKLRTSTAITLAADQYAAATADTLEPTYLFNQFIRPTATQNFPTYGGFAVLAPGLTDMAEGMWFVEVMFTDGTAPTDSKSLVIYKAKCTFASNQRYVTITEEQAIDAVGYHQNSSWPLRAAYLVPINAQESINGFAVQNLSSLIAAESSSVWGIRAIRVLTSVPTLPLDA